MAKNWVVTFEGEKPGPADDFSLEFIDTREVLGSYVEFKPIFMEKIVELVNKEKHYNPIKNIKKIESPEIAELDIKNFWVILGTDNEGRKIGLLLASLEGEKQLLCGIWPPPFVEAIKDNREIFDVFIGALIEKPEFWREVWAVIATE